jgi:hypothetical protein
MKTLGNLHSTYETHEILLQAYVFHNWVSVIGTDSRNAVGL